MVKKYQSTFSNLPPPHNAQSTLGVQIPSTRETFPINSFPKALREAGDKQYISAEHAAVLPGKLGPGPAYDPKLPREAGANYAYGTMVGRAPETIVTFYPGTKIYEPQSMLGVQIPSTRTSEPNYAFGKSTRAKDKKTYVSAEHCKEQYGEGTPGPQGVPVTVSSMGRQSLSVKCTEPRATIGNASRWGRGVDTSKIPGPGAYF